MRGPHRPFERIRPCGLGGVRRRGGWAMGRHVGERWAVASQRMVAAALHTVRESSAQSTLEYAITLVAFLAMIAGLGALVGAASDGTLARLVEAALSHGFTPEGLLDVALY